jgi:5-methylcytosine-specific restriction endonuclease McrA
MSVIIAAILPPCQFIYRPSNYKLTRYTPLRIFVYIHRGHSVRKGESMRPSLRFEVFKRDSFTCRYCGLKSPEAILEVDHVIPRSAGGGDEISNLVTACYLCNRGKSARILTTSVDDLNIHNKTILIAEQEIQIAEYNYWRSRQKLREDGELQALAEQWTERWGEGSHGTRYWQESEVRTFLRKLGYAELSEILDIISEKTTRQGTRGWANSAWTFFCGICWKRIKGHL